MRTNIIIFREGLPHLINAWVERDLECELHIERLIAMPHYCQDPDIVEVSGDISEEELDVLLGAVVDSHLLTNIEKGGVK